MVQGLAVDHRSPLPPRQPLQRIHDQVAEFGVVELHRDAVAEVDLLARRAAEMVHAAHLFKVGHRHALGPAAIQLDPDVGLLSGGDARVDQRRDAACVMDGGILDLQRAAMRGQGCSPPPPQHRLHLLQHRGVLDGRRHGPGLAVRDLLHRAA